MGVMFLFLLGVPAIFLGSDLRAMAWHYAVGIAATIIPAAVFSLTPEFRRRMVGLRPIFDTRRYLLRAGLDTGSMAFMVGSVATAVAAFAGVGPAAIDNSSLSLIAIIGFALVAIVCPRRWANTMSDSLGIRGRFTDLFSTPGQTEDALLQLAATAILVMLAAARPAEMVFPVLLDMGVVLLAHMIGVHLFTIFVLANDSSTDRGAGPAA